MAINYSIIRAVLTLIVCVIASPASAQQDGTPVRPVDAALADKEARLHMATGQCRLDPEMADSERAGRVECNLSAPYGILTMGNSHETHGYYFFRNMLDEYVEANDVQIIRARTHGPGSTELHCSFQDHGLPLQSEQCQWLTDQLNDDAMMAEKYQAILVSSLVPQRYNKGIYLRYAEWLQKRHPDLKVLVLGSFVDLYPHSCPELMYEAQDVNACLDDSLIRYFNPREEADIRKFVPDLEFLYVSQIDLLCDEPDFEACQIAFDGASILRDANHFNRVGIRPLVDRANEAGVTRKVIDYLGLGEPTSEPE